MRRHLQSGLQILVVCTAATVLGFVTAVAVAILPDLLGQGSLRSSADQFTRFVLFGGVPCCSLGTLLALVCWALIPRVHRLSLWRPWVRRTHALVVPYTSGAALRAMRPRAGIRTGMMTGMLLSFFNVPGYIAASFYAHWYLSLCFLSAGAVAGAVIGWCRATRDAPPATTWAG